MIERTLASATGRRLVFTPVATAMYAVILYLVYTGYIVERFSYVGYRFVAPDMSTVVMSWVIATLCAMLLPWRAQRASAILLWTIYVIVIAPTVLTLPYMGSLPPAQGLLFGAATATAFAIATLMAQHTRAGTPSRLGVSTTTFSIVVTVFSVITYGYVAMTTGLSLEFIALTDVYDQRAEYREALAEASLLGYLVSNQANVVNPVILARGVQRRNVPLIGAAVLGQLLLYAATGFKSVLFSLIAMTALLLLFKSSRRPRPILLMWGASGLLAATWIIEQSSDSGIFSSLFARRFLYTPARLSGLYFDWYSHNPLSLLAHSILRPFIDSEYDYGPARTISIYATGSPNTSMNANIFAAGFAEFGWFGLLGVGALLGLFLMLLNRVSAGLPMWLCAVATVMPAITLSNTAFHTALLSHGLVASLIVLAMMPRQGGHRPQPL